MSRQLVITVDYEIFGNGSGDVRQHVTEPTERMCCAAEKYSVPITVYFEVEEYLAFEHYAAELRRGLGYDPAELMRKQTADLARRGHDIQLHLHPQWVGAELSAAGWQLNMEHLTVDSLFETTAATSEYITERQRVLEEMSGRPVMAYRAGGFAAQPGAKLLRALTEAGFTIESSVVKGMHRTKPHPLDFRNAPAGRRLWRVSDEVTREDPAGSLWEIPVHSVMRRRYHQLTLNRLKAKFSGNVPKARQREMVEELGVRANPWSVASFLAQPVPIKLDYDNLTPAALYRMITRAPAAPAGDLDVLVLIGHTKEHTNDAGFEQFLQLIAADDSLKATTFPEVARQLRRAPAAAKLMPAR